MILIERETETPVSEQNTKNTKAYELFYFPKKYGLVRFIPADGKWKRVEFDTKDEVIEIIRTYPYTGIEYSQGHRQGTFLSTKWFAADFDTPDYSIRQFLEEFGKYESFYFTSRNHQRIKQDEYGKERTGSPEFVPCDRFHVLFPLPDPITNVAEFRELNMKLKSILPKADPEFHGHNYGFNPSYGNERFEAGYNPGISILEKLHTIQDFRPAVATNGAKTVSSIESKILEGERHNKILSYAGRTWHEKKCGINSAMIPEWVVQVKAMNDRVCEPPLPEDEVNSITQSIIKKVQERKIKRPVVKTIDEVMDVLDRRYAKIGDKIFDIKNDCYVSKSDRIEYYSATLCEYERVTQVGDRIETEKKTTNSFEYWYRNTTRSFDRVVWKPGEETKEDYNLWTGFETAPKDGDCNLFLAHTKDIICGGNEEHYTYVINWLAQMIQEPNKKPGIALVLQSKHQGTGKGEFVRHIKKLIGEKYFVAIANMEMLTGNFNGIVSHKLLAFCDEAIFYGDRKAANFLKAIETEEHIIINQKGIDARKEENYLHLIFASNEEHVLHLAAEDRRHFVLEVSPAMRENRDYFAALDDQMKNGGYEALMHFLLGVDISQWDRRIPITEAKKQNILHSLPDVQKFFYALVKGELENELYADEDDEKKGVFVSTGDLFQYYTNFSRNHYYRNSSSFGRELAKHFRQYKYRLPDTKISGYSFPPMPEMLAIVERFIAPR